ncbi:MAG: hypothetical protein JOZ47_00090 [Kutzneria sp.]|nr:hypothetical protein [Kutzneria sp.]
MAEERIVLWGVPRILVRGDQRTPGSAEILTQLKQRQQAPLSLLTGLAEAEAVRQVSAVSLDRYLDLDIGGYGSDTPDRETLVDVVRSKVAAKYDQRVPSASVLVTDELVDVGAAVRRGVRVVAVSDDPSHLERLRCAGATHALSDLAATVDVLTAILD